MTSRAQIESLAVKVASLPATHPEVETAIHVAAMVPPTHPLAHAIAKKLAELPPEHPHVKTAISVAAPSGHPIAKAAATHVAKLPPSHPTVKHAVIMAAAAPSGHPVAEAAAKHVAKLPAGHDIVQTAKRLSGQVAPSHPVAQAAQVSSSRALASKVAPKPAMPALPSAKVAQAAAGPIRSEVLGKGLLPMAAPSARPIAHKVTAPHAPHVYAPSFPGEAPMIEPPDDCGHESYGTQIGDNRKRKWSPPSWVETKVEPRGTAGTVFPGGNLRGYFSCCDVWVRAPAGWFTGATKGTVSLYAQEGASEQLVSQVRLDQFTVQSDGTFASCLATYVRGLPCEGFRCEFSFAGDVSGLAAGILRIEAYGEDLPFDISVGGFNVSGLGTSALPIGGILNPPLAPMPVTSLILGRVANGGWAPVHVDTAGDLQVDIASITDPTVTLYDSAGFANSGVIKAAAGKLLSLRWLNQSAATIYLQLFNAVAVPANGTVPSVAPIAIPPMGAIETNGELFPDGWTPFATGISWAASTTVGTLTQTATSPLWVTATSRD